MDISAPINLHTNARQNFLSWRSSIIEAYGQACNVYNRHGLLGYLLSEEAWALLPGNTIIAEPVNDLPALITIAARPVLPDFIPLAAAATAAQQSAWDRNMKILKYNRESYDTLKIRLISSVPADDIAILRNSTTAFLHVTPQAIMEHISMLHGTLDNNDYTQLVLTLTTAMTSSDTISGIVARHRHIHDQFQSSNQSFSEYQKCTYFKNAVNCQQHMRSAYESYIVGTPLISDQNFLTLTNHILTQAPNFTATAADMGYAGSAVTTIPEYFQSAAFAALLTRTVQHAIPPTSVVQKRADSGTKKPSHYCYLHGHNNTHIGSNCFKMLADTSIYTAAHLSATTPSMVANGSTATPGEQRRNNRTHS